MADIRLETREEEADRIRKADRCRFCYKSDVPEGRRTCGADACMSAHLAECKLRKELSDIHGEVLNTAQMQEKYTVQGFCAPFVVVVRDSDGVRGSLEFTHMPRFYFGFQPDKK